MHDPDSGSWVLERPQQADIGTDTAIYAVGQMQIEVAVRYSDVIGSFDDGSLGEGRDANRSNVPIRLWKAELLCSLLLLGRVQTPPRRPSSYQYSEQRAEGDPVPDRRQILPVQKQEQQPSIAQAVW